MYRYAVYGICDVYFILTTSRDNQTLLDWETVVCARPGDYFLRSEYADNRIFNNEPVSTIDIIEDFYKLLPILTAVKDPPSGFPDPYITKWETIHTATKKISDSGGQFKQHFDVVRFDAFDINLETMKQQGYKTISFLIRLDVRELSDGNQHIFLYSSASQSNNYLISEVKFHHTLRKKDSTWWIHYENELRFPNIDIDKFINDQFIIRYGASGDYEDSWENRNLQIQLVLN